MVVVDGLTLLVVVFSISRVCFNSFTGPFNLIILVITVCKDILIVGFPKYLNNRVHQLLQLCDSIFALLLPLLDLLLSLDSPSSFLELIELLVDELIVGILILSCIYDVGNLLLSPFLIVELALFGGSLVCHHVLLVNPEYLRKVQRFDLSLLQSLTSNLTHSNLLSIAIMRAYNIPKFLQSHLLWLKLIQQLRPKKLQHLSHWIINRRQIKD